MVKKYTKKVISMFANFVIVSVIVAAGISIAVSVKGNGIYGHVHKYQPLFGQIVDIATFLFLESMILK